MPALNPGAPPNQLLVSRATESFILHSGTTTVNGDGPNFAVGGYQTGLLAIDVTAASGNAPTLDLRLDFFDSASGKWLPVPGVTVPQFTAPGQAVVAVSSFNDNIRLHWELGGVTPSFTFTAGFHAKS